MDDKWWLVIITALVAVIIIMHLNKEKVYVHGPVDNYGPYDMKFVNSCELIRDSVEWVKHLPRDFDAIIGIPKSGMIVAAVISTMLDIPLGTIENLESGSFYEGSTRRYANSDAKGSVGDKRSLQNIRKVLIVDDTICDGTQIQKLKNRLAGYTHLQGVDVQYGVLYIDCEKYKMHLVDHYYKIIKSKTYKRRFEWNLIKSPIWNRACVDLDGVLCIDPKLKIKDNSPEYLYFIQTAKPLFVPREKIYRIVTGRHQKYRKETENWLKKHNITYDALIMNPGEDHKYDGLRKAVYYTNSDANLFIESSKKQAITIAKYSNKPALCTENMILY